MTSEDEVGLADLPGDLPTLQEAFQLPKVTTYRHLTTGWMNRNWEIIAGQQRYVLKRILAIPPAAAREIHAALSFVATCSIPVCLPIRSLAGHSVVDVDDRSYCLVRWVGGAHLAGEDLSLPAVARLGRLVGRIHQALARMPATCEPRPISSPADTVMGEAAKTTQTIMEIERVITSLADPTPYDLHILRLLRRRADLLHLYAHLRPARQAEVPSRWVHGDLNNRNLLFRGQTVAAVLDWDRMRLSTYADEIVQAGLSLFRSRTGAVDVAKIAAFVAAYRTIVDMESAELAEAVSRRWWKRLTDVWPAEFRYLRGEPSERIANLFPPEEAALEWWTLHRDEVMRAFAG
ncbi:phosphotransferase [Nonomuraea sp. NPDC049695]|uniref:phosphotransferase enzyme family protein n=1 Tax=Nonomuraea sp. NPDC049695 TaxID=3154734 RepID=UPI00342AB47A